MAAFIPRFAPVSGASGPSDRQSVLSGARKRQHTRVWTARQDGNPGGQQRPILEALILVLTVTPDEARLGSSHAELVHPAGPPRRPLLTTLLGHVGNHSAVRIHCS